MSQDKNDKITTPEIVEDKFVVSVNNNMSLTGAGMSDKQKLFLLQKTPKEHIYSRPAKGGGTWDYVTGIYVQKVLNFVFNWNWDFEVVDEWEYPRLSDTPTHIVCKGKLTVKVLQSNKLYEITKTQYGRVEVKYKKDSDQILDIGNDYKSAATDALKKCASMLGIASDIYGKGEFKDIKYEVDVNEEDIKEKISKARKKQSGGTAKAVK